jgi:hypothetical protein
MVAGIHDCTTYQSLSHVMKLAVLQLTILENNQLLSSFDKVVRLVIPIVEATGDTCGPTASIQRRNASRPHSQKGKGSTRIPSKSKGIIELLPRKD